MTGSPHPDREVRLVCHVDARCPVVREIRVQVRRRGKGQLALTYVLTGEVDHLRIPDPGDPVRADRLWEHTCFEAFLKEPGGEGYREYNFAPSGAWAAYAFSSYRSGGMPAEVAAPTIRVDRSPDCLQLEATLSPGAAWLGLSAVIEDSAGNCSYWAIRHPPGRPDFHHSDAFALDLS